MDYGVFNEVTLLWVKNLTPLEYGSEDTALAMSEELAAAIAADLSTGYSSLEREHPQPPQPHTEKKIGRPGDRQPA